ncbi:MAG: hypothetical protein K0S08_1726 [Gammaproteobacteria bacterium]|jgi:prepilin-type N-terminal cleavage/methylation domain-containing protein|nr:hypothetical protein [Gammaproteobacteria bacterium]
MLGTQDMDKQSLPQGFTFLELVVALVVTCILAVASVPIIRQLLLENRLRAAAETFAQYIQTARSEAIQRQQNAYLVLQSGSTWCYGVNAGSTCSCSPSNTCTLGSISSTDYIGITTTVDTGFTSNSIYFDSVRGLPNEASTVSFTTSNKLVKVQISQLGNITMCATNVTGYKAC